MSFPVHCTACGHPLPSVDAGPCPECGSTAKTLSMAAAGYAQSAGRAALETVIVGSVNELRAAISKQKEAVIWTLPHLPLLDKILYGMFLLAILAMALS